MTQTCPQTPQNHRIEKCLECMECMYCEVYHQRLHAMCTGCARNVERPEFKPVTSLLGINQIGHLQDALCHNSACPVYNHR